MSSYLSLFNNKAADSAYNALDYGLLPDFAIRRAIRYLCNQRLAEIAQTDMATAAEHKWAYIADMKKRPIAIEQDKANEQHYHTSSDFMLSCLGPRLKYSCCLYPTGKETLEQAEVLMLESYCEKAKLVDGMDVLDLGCGWGSLSLFLGEKYPNSKISSLSNSASQKVFIDDEAKKRGLTNITVYTGDVNVYDFPEDKRFDRVISIEMLEHMKNYEAIFAKVGRWLKPNGASQTGEALFFAHIFCHKSTPYHFEENDGWMSKNFFSGGTMPSFDLFAFFQGSMTLERSWWLPGTHYARTCEHWLQNQDRHAKTWIGAGREGELVTGTKKGDGEKERAEEGKKTFYRFRVFYLACAEFFNLNKGESWGIGHYVFRKRD